MSKTIPDGYSAGKYLGTLLAAQKPTNREWQGLTDEDKTELGKYWHQPGVGTKEFMSEIERVLRVKNSDEGVR